MVSIINIVEVPRHRRGVDNGNGTFTRQFGIIPEEPFDYEAVAEQLEPALLRLSCFEWGRGFPAGTVRMGKPFVSDPIANGVRIIRYTFVVDAEADEPILVVGG